MELGFRQGGPAGYGLRRQLIDRDRIMGCGGSSSGGGSVGTPNGSYTAVLTAGDGKYTTTQTFNVTVSNAESGSLTDSGTEFAGLTRCVGRR